VLGVTGVVWGTVLGRRVAPPPVAAP
jgi:hypothetical protein